MDFKYPYTDFHELNLDWILSQMKQLIADWAEFKISDEEFRNAYYEWKGTVNDFMENMSDRMLSAEGQLGAFTRWKDEAVTPVLNEYNEIWHELLDASNTNPGINILAIENHLGEIGDPYWFSFEDWYAVQPIVQAKTSVKFIPCILNYDGSLQTYIINEQLGAGSRYEFERYLTDASLDVDGSSNGTNIVFLVQEIQVNGVANDTFPHDIALFGAEKTVRIKKNTIPSEFVQYNGTDVHFDFLVPSSQLFNTCADYVPLIMYSPSGTSDTHSRHLTLMARPGHAADLEQAVQDMSDTLGGDSGLVAQVADLQDAAPAPVNRLVGTLAYNSNDLIYELNIDGIQNYTDYIDKNDFARCSYFKNFIIDVMITQPLPVIAGSDSIFLMYNGSYIMYNGAQVYLKVGFDTSVRYDLKNNFYRISFYNQDAYFTPFEVTTRFYDNANPNIVYDKIALGANLSLTTGLNQETYLNASGGGIEYSTSETEVGTWIDGTSPVYQITFKGTKTFSQYAARQELDLGGEYTPIEIDVVVAPASAGIVSSYYFGDLNNFEYHSEMGYSGTNTKVVLYALPSTSTSCKYLVTVKYIKTSFYNI